MSAPAWIGGVCAWPLLSGQHGRVAGQAHEQEVQAGVGARQKRLWGAASPPAQHHCACDSSDHPRAPLRLVPNGGFIITVSAWMRGRPAKWPTSHIRKSICGGRGAGEGVCAFAGGGVRSSRQATADRACCCRMLCAAAARPLPSPVRWRWQKQGAINWGGAYGQVLKLVAVALRNFQRIAIHVNAQHRRAAQQGRAHRQHGLHGGRAGALVLLGGGAGGPGLTSSSDDGCNRGLVAPDRLASEARRLPPPRVSPFRSPGPPPTCPQSRCTWSLSAAVPRGGWAGAVAPLLRDQACHRVLGQGMRVGPLAQSWQCGAGMLRRTVYSMWEAM